MKIKCFVDQAEAFRRGIDAPSSVASIEVNPADLSQEMRDFIADNLDDGYKLRALIWDHPEKEAYHAEGYYNGESESLRLHDPSYEGFLEAVNRGMEFRRQLEKKRALIPKPKDDNPTLKVVNAGGTGK